MPIALVAGLLIVSGPAFAHHGGAVYDTKNPITLKGIVTDFEFVNPHVQIYFDVKEDKGNVVHWVCETVQSRQAGPGIWLVQELTEGWGRNHDYRQSRTCRNAGRES